MEDELSPEREAVRWMGQVCADFAATLPASVRAVFVVAANERLHIMREICATAERHVAVPDGPA